MFSLIGIGINGWVNNHEAVDLRRYQAQYDVTVMPDLIWSTWVKPNLSMCWDTIQNVNTSFITLKSIQLVKINIRHCNRRTSIMITKVDTPGLWFNIKMTSYQYRKSHCGDKTILRPSYLHNGISYTGKMTSLYWIGAQNIIVYVLHDFTHPW